MDLFKLNISQKQIALSEMVNGGSALNTISVKMHMPGTAPCRAKEAVDAALCSADIFKARIIKNAQEWEISYSDAVLSHAVILSEMAFDEAEEYMNNADTIPLDTDGGLYAAEIIPLSSKGCFVYVRFHHVIIDGYGMSLFAQRVLDALAGKELSYSVFAENSVGGEPSDSSDFWRAYFSEAEFEGSVYPEKAVGHRGSTLFERMPSELRSRLADFAEKHSLTEAYVLAAAYAMYLSNATGKRDAVFLMPRLSRTSEQMKTPGCYTLLVPVRVRVEQDESFAELCNRLAESARVASANKDMGFDRILSVLRENGDINDSVSEYVFNFYRYDFDTDIDCAVSYSVAGAMRNHLTFNVFRSEDGGYDLRLDYHDDVYTRERAEYFVQALFGILESGICNKTVSEIEAVGAEEKERILAVKGRSFPVSEELTIPSLFRRAAAEHGEKPALYAGDDAFTFAELDEISDRIATALVKRGVVSGDCVGFMLNRDSRLIPTVLGISKAGAAFIPVDPAYPQDRVDYIIENSKAAYLISSENVANSEKYDYLEVNDLLSETADESILPAVKQDQLAYIIYTSGTTGRPKGVMLSHKGIANITHPDNNPFNRDITVNCRGIVAIGSICFDISLFEIFVPLMNGLFVEFGTEKAMVDAAELTAHITRHNADILHCTPSRIAAYLGNDGFAEALRGVKAILAAGEVLPGSLVEELRDNYGIRIYNGYGPTETTIGATITEAGDTTTIGLPISNMGVLMLNGNNKLVPYGAVGEICVWGNGVGIGYKDRAEETASKYIMWNGMRVYRTGDLGHFSEDGRIIYHGRNDRQIKLRGLRIELSEIEKVLGEYSGIAACSCLVRKIDSTEHLVGFYTTAVGAQVDAAELRAHMKSRLTSYMVPDVLKELSSMPQTPNGKTDVRALALEPIEYVRKYRKPISHREKEVCSVFEHVLETERIGLDDNFFERGGNSLKAATAMLQIEDRLELEAGQADFGDLYKYPTPALLLEKLYGETEDDPGYDIRALDYKGIDEFIAAHTADSTKKAYLGNVLITGVTGYLGIHILIDLLKRPDICGKIVCLARPKKTLSAERRVKTTLFYFDEEDFSEGYGDKWMVCEGDITDPNIFTGECPVHIDTVINSAANVAHFAYGDVLERINTEGVKNLIDFALREKAMLCQISTISVAGVTHGDVTKDGFSERDFYIGQQIYNQYIYSKYMAEYYMLRAAVDKGLRIKLMRVGNLQGRIQDGEFQMNRNSNAFTRQLSSYIKIGYVPEAVYHGSVNFSPVDETAHNIVSLAATDDGTVAFNIYPPKEVAFADIFDGLERLGHHTEVVSDEEFAELLHKLKRSDEGKEQAEGLFTRGMEGDFRDVPVIQNLTNSYIEQLGDSWSTITEDYLNKYLSALDGMDVF